MAFVNITLEAKESSGKELKPIIPAITKGSIAPKAGKYDNTAILSRTQEKAEERNPLQKGVTSIRNLYDFREFLQAEDVEGYIATTFRLTIEQCLKQEFEIVGLNTELAAGIRKQLKAICKASSTTLYNLIENLITGLVKFNNAFLIVVRKEFPGSKFKSYRFRGKDVNPIAGLFYVEPQYMTPVLKDGKLEKWEYDNPDIGAQTQEFRPDQVIHMQWNKKGNDIFGTPWILPALDDVRMLRRLEEFVQMLISKHLFPIYQYKVGDKDSPSVVFEGGTSEVAIVQNQVGDLPQQGCIFTSHRHEIVAIDSNGALEIGDYVKHFDSRALSSCGLSGLDVGRSETSNKACYSEDTQTLTENGFKFYWEIDYKTEKIATVNPLTGEIEYHLSEGLWLYDHEGTMHHYKSKSVDVLVTDNHTMWYGRPGNSSTTWELAESKDIPVDQVFFKHSTVTPIRNSELVQLPYVPYDLAFKHSDPGPLTIKDTTLLEFLGYFVTEGCLTRAKNNYGVNIDQNPGRKADKIRECLTKLAAETHIKLNETIASHGCIRFSLHNKSLHAYLMQCGHGASDKRLPREVFNYSREALANLFEAMILGDGTEDAREGRNCGAFYSSSSTLIDQFQELCVHIGYKSKVKSSAASWGSLDMFRVLFVRDKLDTKVTLSKNRSEIVYSGKVYCYRVKNHLFVTRRNGVVAIHGNTAGVMNKTRADRCTRIQRIMSEFFGDQIIFSLVMELGLDPFDEENEISLSFPPIDTEERRAQEQHDLQLFQNDILTHAEMRKAIRRKAFQSDEEWENTFSNTTKRMGESMATEASTETEKQKAVTKQVTRPANQSNPGGKTKPKVSARA